MSTEIEVLQNQKTTQQDESAETPKQVPFLQHAATSGRKVSTINSQSPPDTLCPSCGHTVRVGATYCPNCRYQLSPLARGTHPTLNISSVPAVPIIDQGFAPSATNEHPPVKEAAWDDLAIQATLKRLWDKVS